MVDIARRTTSASISRGPGHWALRSTIGHAAKLTVKGDHFRPYIGEPDNSSRAG
jgi:hypothetical protein